ncbi:unnamed protein product [Schistosoma margrebowiei]|uniref:Uncharacterized protein n=1 Tax=Schistosoma margrebowiei TaxID=48269 RepID=A0A183LSC5_9TREM|nr:unnamed protein product [Schistosoma margrebowiei]
MSCGFSYFIHVSAFSIFNDWVRFVFASDSEIDRSKWMNKLGLASIGLSSTIPNSRIGGFNPGYVVLCDSKNNEVKAEIPHPHSCTVLSDSPTKNFQGDNTSGLRSQTLSTSKTTDFAENSLTVVTSQPVSTPPRHVTLHSVSSPSFSTFDLRSNSLPSEPRAVRSIIFPRNSALPPSIGHSSPAHTRTRHRQPLEIPSVAFGCYSESEDEIDEDVEAECDVDDNCISEGGAQLNLRNRPGSASPSHERRYVILNSTEENECLQEYKKLISCKSELHVSDVHASMPLSRPLRAAHIITKNLHCSDKLLGVEKIVGLRNNEPVPECSSRRFNN